MFTNTAPTNLVLLTNLTTALPNLLEEEEVVLATIVTAALAAKRVTKKTA